MNFLAVFVGGGLGSLSRYLLGLFISKIDWPNFPLATFLANILACSILALTLFFLKDKLEQSSALALLIITGFCGGFSTFSTFSLETVQLIQQGNSLWAILNVAISLIFGIGIIWLLKTT